MGDGKKYRFYMYSSSIRATISTENGYFSIVNNKGFFDREHMLLAFPALKALIDLQGADIVTGTPDHARDHTTWWLSGSWDWMKDVMRSAGAVPHQSVVECRELLQRHLRIDDAEMEEFVKHAHARAFPEKHKPLAVATILRHVATHKIKQLKPQWRWDATMGMCMVHTLSLEANKDWA